MIKITTKTTIQLIVKPFKRVPDESKLFCCIWFERYRLDIFLRAAERTLEESYQLHHEHI